MSTNYPGIDYGLGKSNVDTNGIRYGMISQHSLDCCSLDDVFDGQDLGYDQAEAELKDRLRRALSDYFSDYRHDDKPSRLDSAVDNAFDALDGWADNLESSGPYRYESANGTVQTTDNNELWVFKSRFYTYAQYCSPCVPGAGNLNSPFDGPVEGWADAAKEAGFPRVYCLGHDWFEDSVAPYPVFSVETNEQIQP